MSAALSAADLERIRALPADATRIELDELERKYIEREIQPWVEKRECNSKFHDRLLSFEVRGSGINKWLQWTIQAGVECDGCYGRGDITSNRGTRTECPDCWGSGVLSEGDTRTVLTDYDGDPLRMAA